MMEGTHGLTWAWWCGEVAAEEEGGRHSEKGEGIGGQYWSVSKMTGQSEDQRAVFLGVWLAGVRGGITP